MVVNTLRGVIRGGGAWAVGYAAMLGLIVLGVIDDTGDLIPGADVAYLHAHQVPVFGAGVDSWAVIVPVTVLTVAGYRGGRSVRAGLTGRLRAAIEAVRGSKRDRVYAAIGGALTFAGGYTLMALVGAVVVGASIGTAMVGGLGYALVVVGVAAVGGALR